MTKNNVLHMDDYRVSPSLLIKAGRTTHVYPVSYFVDFVNGEAVEPIPDDVVKAIVGEWLSDLGFPVDKGEQA